MHTYYLLCLRKCKESYETLSITSNIDFTNSSFYNLPLLHCKKRGRKTDRETKKSTNIDGCNNWVEGEKEGNCKTNKEATAASSIIMSLLQT